MREPIPTYWIGEELTLSWRMRNCGVPEEERDDFNASVIDEDGESIVVLGPEGHQHTILRANGHEFERVCDGERGRISRQEARWVVVDRPQLEATPASRKRNGNG